MNLNKSTRYGLYAAMELARESDGATVTVARVAERYGIPETVLAKALQQLVRAGLAHGTRGMGGGYRLARPPSEVTVLDVMEAFEPSRSQGQCLLAERDEPSCAELDICRLRRLFDEVDGMVSSTLASVTLDTLVGRRAGPDRPLEVVGRDG